MTQISLLVADIETLGMSPPAAVIELGWCSLTYDDHQGTDVPSWFAGEDSGSALFSMRGQVMSSDNRAVHHIDPANLEGRVAFVDQRWHKFSSVTPLYGVAHNSEFEESFLGSEIPWICTYKVALRLLPDAPSHGNQALKYELGIGDAPAHHPPHRALPDCIVTALVFEQLFSIAVFRQPEMSVEDILSRMAAISREPRLLPRCPIGKQKGRPWAEIDHGFLTWMLRQPDMEHDLRWNAERELTRRRRGDAP